MEQNMPLGEICLESVILNKFLLCSAWAMSFLSSGPDVSSSWMSCVMHMSAVHVRFLRHAVFIYKIKRLLLLMFNYIQ